ncbi:MAG: DUF4258 domain-containing protein [Phormidesmis sp.]
MSDDDFLSGEVLFEAETPLGFSVRTTLSYWELITSIKHPAMRGRLEDVRQTLLIPDEIRVSKSDEQVYMFYQEDGTKRWVCAVAKRLDTIYRTSAIKEGKVLWRR